MLTAESFFDLLEFSHARLFSEGAHVWSALNNLERYMDEYAYPDLYGRLVSEGVPLARPVVFLNGALQDAEDFSIRYGDAAKGKIKVFQEGRRLADACVIMAGAVMMGDKIALGKGTLVESGALIKSPAIIGDNTEVRQGAYLRGYCLTGNGCVIGHTTEVKHSIFLDHAKAGHFAYLGDSILGREVNLGAGTKFANLKMIKGNINLHMDGKFLDTGRRKFGAILGDFTQTGCNAVTSPGTLLGKKSMVMPNATVEAGYHPPRSFIR